MVCAIAEKIVTALNVDLYFLDDIPYSIKSLETANVVYEKNLTKKEVKYKHKIMSTYNSQMCDFFYNVTKYLNRERLFVAK